MPSGRIVEIGAWVLGVTLLGQYAVTRAAFEDARLTGIESFREASQSTLVDTAPAADAAQPAHQIDRSLWSENRINAFTGSAENPVLPEAVLSIPALQLEVPVYAGVTEFNLNRGAAHIENTAALSDFGNIGIAAHRDGFFRKLKDIAIGDEVDLDVGGRTLRYRVVDISIVMPSEVSVLDPTETPSITLVTCYPFYFVGSAPERYIVRAELVNNTSTVALAADGPSRTKL